MDLKAFFDMFVWLLGSLTCVGIGLVLLNLYFEVREEIKKKLV